MITITIILGILVIGLTTLNICLFRVINNTKGERKISVNDEEVTLRGGEEVRIGDIEIVFYDYGDDRIEIFPGDVTGSVRTVNARVCVRGDVSGDVSTTTGDIYITGDISGSVDTISGDINIEGYTAGSVNTVSGDIYT